MTADIVALAAAPRENEIDIGALEALRDALGAREAREFVEDGVFQTIERLAALERALAKEDWPRVRRTASDLVDWPERLGMRCVAQRARALIDCCASGDPVSSHAVAARLLRAGRAALLSPPFRTG